MPGPPLGAFVADHHHVAGNDLVGEDAGHRIVLAFENARAAGEFKDAVVHAGGLDDAAVQRDIAVQHRQSAILRIGMGLVADAALDAVVSSSG